MALIDVSELLVDPDFVDQIDTIQRVKGVDSNGRTIMIATPRVITGSVQPASGEALQMLPDLVRTSGMLEIWTQSILTVDTDSRAADIIVWKGNRYIVAAKVDDYQNYGAGYTHAVLTLQDVI